MSPSTPISQRRLFVCNLSESVDEYTLIKFLSKHGKISKFDYLFHKSGPKQGKPRGYAFVEYATSEEALKTMIELDGKLLLGRKVAIKRANEAPPEHSNNSSAPGAWRNNAQKHTTLSVLKGHGKSESAESKIKALEAKLQALEAQKASTSADNSRHASASTSEAEGTPAPESSTLTANEPEAGPSTLPSTIALPSSLPPKPPSSLPSKPDADTITRGEKAQKSHKAEMEQKQEQKYDQQRQHRGPHNNRDRNKKAVEVPKSTLASLGASMGR
ncbi:RNA-binding domain-containing protein [Cystobasidium minutum MCA 4210]|uniref:RNA-binding domain-containing protein n=1 Tax=Cystobasidium minutum MCA 4210 TaxID=1397322 RepID=UPI0034CD93BF|eukprot:jgi/Rhomi1/197179/gm1.5393_g